MIAAVTALPMTAQHTLELSWTEVSQELTLIPASVDVAQLSDPERLAAMTYAPDTSRRLTGYSPDRGVYHERHVLNPYRLHEDWQAAPAAHYVSDRSGRLVTATDGTEIKRSPPATGWRGDHLAAMALAYDAGELEPIRDAFLPTAEELQALEAEGYRILSPSLAVAARTSGADATAVPVTASRTHVASLPQNLPKVSLTLEKPGTRLAYDEASLTYSRVEYADENNLTPIRYVVRRYGSAEHLGREGILPLVEVRSHYDTLTHGSVLVRSAATLRRGYEYRYDGRATGSGVGDASQALAVFPNPLAGGMLTVTVPEDLAGGFHLELRDAAGRLVRERGYPANAGVAVDLEIDGGLAPGLYHVSLSGEHHAAYTAPVIVTR